MKRIATILAIFASSLNITAQTGNESKVRDPQTNQEEVIGWPESMTAQADSLMMHWLSKHYLYPDTNGLQHTTPPAYTPEIIQERLSRLPNIIEMPYNNIVQECVDKYVTTLRRTVSFMLGAGNFYIPLFEEMLDRAGLPLELKYLPVIESALDPLACSSSGATGLWQITLPTAQRYALEINSLVDERRDPYASTVAAVQYLKDLYHIYGDWNLVIAAYNCGPGNVNKAIHRSGGKRDYWAIYPELPNETRGYVPAFIAANYAMNYYCEHGISPMKTRIPVKTDTIMVNRNLHMKQIEKFCGIDLEAIKALNPQYRTEIIPGASKPRTLRLPQEAILAFLDQQDTIYKYQAEELLTRRNTVPKITSSAKETSRQQEKSSNAKYVTVRRGDTLGAIARRNRTTVSKIKRLNGMRSDRLKPGKRLRVR